MGGGGHWPLKIFLGTAVFFLAPIKLTFIITPIIINCQYVDCVDVSHCHRHFHFDSTFRVYTFMECFHVDPRHELFPRRRYCSVNVQCTNVISKCLRTVAAMNFQANYLSEFYDSKIHFLHVKKNKYE